MEEEARHEGNYLPFILAGIVSALFFAFSDLYLLGIRPMNEWQQSFYYVPMLNLFLMAGVIYLSLKLEFEIPVILGLGIIVLLFVPSLFIVIFALGGTYNPYVLIEFYPTLG